MKSSLATWLAGCFLLVAASGGAADPSPAQRLGCVACHGENGISSLPHVPNLAGQNRLYLVKQLRDFDTSHASAFKGLEGSERRNPVMEQISAGLKEAQIQAVAGYYAGLPCPAGRARKLRPPPAFGRDCVRCHGPGGINLRPGIPDLGGQKTAYLVKQLHALNATARSAACDEAANLRCDPVMSGHAVRLTVDQMSSLAEYFSEFGCRTVR